MIGLIILTLAAVAQASPPYLYDPSYYKAYAVPVVKPDGHIADTPEVAAAKIDHLRSHAIATSAAAPAYVEPVAYVAPPAYVAHARAAYVAPVHTAYVAPVHAAYVAPAYKAYAVPTVLPSGFLADTPEVAAAKNAHFYDHVRAIHH